LERVKEDLAAGRLTEEEAAGLSQLTETLISLEKAKWISPEALAWRADI
jgi:hypothetical protein